MKRILLKILISLILVSCSTTKTISKKEITLDEILEEMKLNSVKIQSYSAIGDVDLNLNSLKMKLSFSIQSQKPHKVLIDLFGILGIDIASIYLNNDSILVYNAINNELISTNFSSNKIKRSKLSLIADKKIYSILFGEFDLNSFEADSASVKDYDDKFSLIKYFSNNRIEVFYDKTTSFISEIIYYSSTSNNIFEIFFKEIKVIDGIKFPSKIFINNSNSNETISLEFKKIEFNKNIGELELIYPDDAEIKEW
ncbi:MAG: DUF4292 domain-containing protein [Ignavibacteria bacterium]|nr:DUF4292 domain-containing protein [Ignavibacteria bacterium]